MTSKDCSPPACHGDELIERTLEAALRDALSPESPDHLRQAMEAAVFPGGARIRPRLCLKVFDACGATYPALAESAAAAIELLHCASLVHDDLPCFDNAELRRGKPTVHRMFGEPTAVLAGDALIVLAFRSLSLQAALAPDLAVRMIDAIADAIGPTNGLIAGQSMEAMTHASIDRYHHCKTSSLFVAATVCGALAGGADPAPWKSVGKLLGCAYQIADDIADTTGTVESIGKLPGVDSKLGRPSIVRSKGLDAAMAMFNECVEQIADTVPAGPNKASIADWLRNVLRLGLARPAQTGLA